MFSFISLIIFYYCFSPLYIRLGLKAKIQRAEATLVGWRTDQDRAGAPVPIQDEVLIESRAPCPGHLLQPCCLSSTTFANALYKTYLLNSCAPCRRTTSKELCRRDSRNKSESRPSDNQAAKNFNTSRQVLTATHCHARCWQQM